MPSWGCGSCREMGKWGEIEGKLWYNEGNWAPPLLVFFLTYFSVTSDVLLRRGSSACWSKMGQSNNSTMLVSNLLEVKRLSVKLMRIYWWTHCRTNSRTLTNWSTVRTPEELIAELHSHSVANSSSALNNYIHMPWLTPEHTWINYIEAVTPMLLAENTGRDDNITRSCSRFAPPPLSIQRIFTSQRRNLGASRHKRKILKGPRIPPPYGITVPSLRTRKLRGYLIEVCWSMKDIKIKDTDKALLPWQWGRTRSSGPKLNKCSAGI